MKTCRSWFVLSAGCLAAVLASALTANASPIFVEGGDAGELIGTAQSAGSGPLDAIQGALTPPSDSADLFQIYLTAGQAFSATTTASSFAFNSFDMALFLFNSAGLGLLANDDDPAFAPLSTIAFTPVVSGLYYLAIAGVGYDPISAGGAIFPAAYFGSTSQFGPTGPGGGSALSSWNSTTSEGDVYEIRLTGVGDVTQVPVPEPASASLLLVGLAVRAAVARRHRRAPVSSVNGRES